jgi:predicted ATPase
MPRAMELVGRERERAALRDAIATAAGGDGGLFLVAGEGGVGKTALVESALAEDGRVSGSVERRTGVGSR